MLISSVEDIAKIFIETWETNVSLFKFTEISGGSPCISVDCLIFLSKSVHIYRCPVLSLYLFDGKELAPSACI